MGFSTLKLNDFAGGVDFLTSPFKMPPDRSPSCENVLPLRSLGAIRKRRGRIDWNAAIITGETEISGMDYFFAHVGAIDEGFICQSGTKLYRGDPATGTWAAITGATGLTSNAKAQFVSYLGRVYMCNGVDPVGRYNGVNYSTAGWTAAPPNGGKIHVHMDRGYMIGVPGNPMRLQYSEKGDLENWTVSGYIDDMEEEGRVLVGLATLGGALYILTEGSIWGLFGNDPGDWVLRKILDGIGCAEERTVCVKGEWIYFMSHIGPMRFNGSSVQPIGKVVEPFLEDEFDWANVGANSLCATFYRGRYWVTFAKIGVTPAGRPNYTLIWDEDTNSWWPCSNIKISCYVQGKSEESNRTLYGAGCSEAKAYLLDVGGADSGAVIPWHYRTVWMGGPEDFGFGRVRRVHVLHGIGAASQTATVKYSTDLSTSMVVMYGTTGTLELDSPGPVWGSGYADKTRTIGYHPVSLPSGSSGFIHTIELSGSDAEEPVPFYAISPEFEDRPLR